MSREKTAIQQALIELRKRGGLTQLELALQLGVTPVTTARWESSHLPHGKRLNQLSQLAEEKGASDLAKVFRGALQREEQLSADYHSALWDTDESFYFQIAISQAWSISGAPRVAARWDRLVDDLIFILRQKIRYLQESPAFNPQLRVNTPPSKQMDYRERPETKNLQSLIRRLIDQRRAGKKAQKELEASLDAIGRKRKRT
jgi:transcriptional regulator with XRE-family HTH domain